MQQATAQTSSFICFVVVLQVNGQPTPDLDTFLSVVSPLKDGDFARVKVCHLETTQQKVWCCCVLLILTR